MSRKPDAHRRHLLKLGGAAVSAPVLAGCLDSTDDEPDDGDDGGGTEADTDEPATDVLPTVENPPDEVYLPTHREGMVMGEAKRAGDYLVAPMYAVPHRFWLIMGDTTEEVVPDEDDDVHLMVSVWDSETGIVLPADAGMRITVERDGKVVDERNPWTMVSQEMGFHFGDNFRLDGRGGYDVRVEVGTLETVERVGELEGRFEDGGVAEFTFDFSDETLNEMVAGVEYLDQSDWGEPGALEPMEHGHGDHHDEHGDNGQGDGHEDEHGDEHRGDYGHDDHEGMDHGIMHPPYSSLPEPEELPGELLGTPTSGGAVLAATVTDAERFVGDDGSNNTDDNREGTDGDYLIVSPRTPYNSCVLPSMSLSAEVVRDGETVETVRLTETLDHEAEYHYGAHVGLGAGDTVVISVDTPPQVPRHQGYETAFIEMPDVELPVPEEYEP